MCTLRVSVPPEISCWDVAAQGAELNLHLPWALLALCPCCAISLWEFAATVTPPGAVSWQPFPAPHTSSVPVGSVCWECASFLGISFCSRQSFWAVSFRVWLQKSLKGRITMRFVKVLLSDPTWQPVLCVGGCCVFALQGINVPFPIQPSRSQRLLQEYSSSASLCDN